MTEVIITRGLGDRYERGCRQHFGLSPRELATLCAIAAYVSTHGVPMPRSELDRAAVNPELQDFYAVDLATPGRLFREGLIRLIGFRENRSYDISAAGLERLSR